MNKILKNCVLTAKIVKFNIVVIIINKKKRPFQYTETAEAGLKIMPALPSSWQSIRCNIQDGRHGVRTEPLRAFRKKRKQPHATLSELYLHFCVHRDTSCNAGAHLRILWTHRTPAHLQ